jgi:hypothetical protein
MADGYTSGGKPIPEYWIGQVTKGKQFRSQYAHEPEWPTWRRWYRGEWNPRILPSNVYFKTMRTLIPRVYYRNPSVSLTPSKPGLENLLLCKLLERADNKLIDVMGLKEQMKHAVQHSCMFGTGFIRLGYGAEFTPTPEDIDTAEPDAGGAKVRKRVEYNDLVHPNMPWTLCAHPGSVILPHGCSDIHSARWICFECTRPLDDIKADPRFDNVKDLMAGVSEGKLLARAPSMSARDREGVVLWEIRDKKTGLVFVLAPHAVNTRTDSKVLFCAEDELTINGRLPAYPLIFNNDDEVFWGIPDSQIIAPQQGEKNEIRTQLRNHRRVAIAKLLYETGAVDPDEMSKLIDGNANVGVQVKNINGVRELNNSGIQQVIQILERVEAAVSNDVQELLGMGVNQFGEYAPGSADRSATEANIVNQATMIRIDERRDACADLLVSLITDLNHTIIERWTGDIVQDVIGPAGIPIWLRAQQSEMRDALYETKVDPDTSLPQTKALREQKAVQLYGILKTNPMINPVHLTQFLLTEMYGVDADFLLNIPLFNTTEEKPMEVGQAAQQMRALPPPNMEKLQSALAANPAQVIPPQFQS